MHTRPVAPQRFDQTSTTTPADRPQNPVVEMMDQFFAFLEKRNQIKAEQARRAAEQKRLQELRAVEEVMGVEELSPGIVDHHHSEKRVVLQDQSFVQQVLDSMPSWLKTTLAAGATLNDLIGALDLAFKTRMIFAMGAGVLAIGTREFAVHLKQDQGAVELVVSYTDANAGDFYQQYAILAERQNRDGVWYHQSSILEDLQARSTADLKANPQGVLKILRTFCESKTLNPKKLHPGAKIGSFDVQLIDIATRTDNPQVWALVINTIPGLDGKEPVDFLRYRLKGDMIGYIPDYSSTQYRGIDSKDLDQLINESFLHTPKSSDLYNTDAWYRFTLDVFSMSRIDREVRLNALRALVIRYPRQYEMVLDILQNNEDVYKKGALTLTLEQESAEYQGLIAQVRLDIQEHRLLPGVAYFEDGYDDVE